MTRAIKTAIITDTVLHYRLASIKKRPSFLSWLDKEKLQNWESAVTICEILASEREDRFKTAALKFSQETTSYCLPSPDIYSQAWIAQTVHDAKTVETVNWEDGRDKFLSHFDNRAQLVEMAREIVDKANDFAFDISKNVRNLGSVLYEAFPQLLELYPDGMQPKDVKKVFRSVAKNSELQKQLAWGLMRWFGVKTAHLTRLQTLKPLHEIDRVKVLVLYYQQLWADTLDGRKMRPNDREDFLLLTYLPTVKYILTGDDYFARTAKQVCSGTIYENAVCYIADKTEFIPE